MLRPCGDDTRGASAVLRKPTHPFMRVVYKVHISTLRARSGCSTGTDAEHLDVMSMDDVRLEAVEYWSESKLVVIHFWQHSART